MLKNIGCLAAWHDGSALLLSYVDYAYEVMASFN